MFDLSNPNTFWLNTINLILSVVTVVCFLFVAKVAYQRFRIWLEKRTHVSGMMPQIGITMADGGTRFDGGLSSRSDVSFVVQDEENIFRSEN